MLVQTIPLDCIEDIVSIQEWTYQRINNDEMVVEIPGQWCEYRLHFFWQADIHVLHINCYTDLNSEPLQNNEIYILITLVNQKLALGHFEISAKDQYVYYRYALLLSLDQVLRIDYIEDLIEIVISECEKFYSAFQFLIFGQKSAHEAISVALLETVGEA